MDIKINDKEMSISQTKYIDDLLTKYQMQDCNPSVTPMEENLNIESNEDAAPITKPVQELVGSLIYLSIC